MRFFAFIFVTMKSPGARRLALLVLGGSLALTAQAQTVHWEADPGSPSALQLVFDDCAPDGQPALPAIPGATLAYAGESQSMNIVNFQMSKSVTLSYVLRARQSGPVQIPAFSVKTDRGTLRVAAFNAAGPSASLESTASSKLEPERTTVWAGEVFGLTYQLSASRRNNPQVNQTFDWNSAPLVAEDWSKPEVNEAVRNGERRLEVIYHTRAYAKTPNTLKLEAASHLLNVQTGSVAFGLFSQPRMEPMSVTSDQPVIEVRPLPPSPAGFSGAVGQFTLVSKVVPEKAAVGEPVTWTLELSGTGNWPDIAGLPSRDVSNDFQVVQPKARRTPAEGKLFDVSLAEDVVLVPSKPGSYTLGPINFTYFDPKAGSYKTITAPRTTITITAPPTPQFNVMPPATAGAIDSKSGSAAAGSSTAPQPPSKQITSPAPPEGLPHDPLSGSAVSPLPLALRTWLIWLLAPVPFLMVFWFWLAIRRAERTDPLQPRRAARLRLAATLHHLQTAPEAERPALLLAWQRDAAALWAIPHAAPPARALPDPAWARLWTESDRALYGPNAALPADWIARAQEALAAKRVPGLQPWKIFLPRNLFPFAALIAFAFLVAGSSLRAASEADAAYRRGDFARAEKLWRESLQRDPTDSFARHNLSLALMQQERFGEAAAQAAAAFVQNPPESAIQRQFALASERAGIVPAPLAAFLHPGPLQDVAVRFAPSEWQRVLIGAVFVGALALGWMLFNAYGRRRSWVYWTAGAICALSAVVGAGAVAGWTSYGRAADERAVVVVHPGVLRSIPTEADTTQKTTPLPAGALALMDKKLLGWVRLNFDNGQTGWVRIEEVIPLWRYETPPAQ